MLRYDGPLIVQADRQVLLDERHPRANEARESLCRFADLVKRPGDLHTYRITPLSVWNAAAAGVTPEEIADCLVGYSRYDVPASLLDDIGRLTGRYGKLRLERRGDEIVLVTFDSSLAAELGNLAGWAEERPSGTGVFEWTVPGERRGTLKQELIRRGYPVLDLAGYHQGESLPVELRERAAGGRAFSLRDYQERAVDLFYREGDKHGGSGMLVLPCGAGKTVIGIAALSRLRCATLILTSNVTSVRQWKSELLDKTTLTEEDVGEYAGHMRDIKPVTIATYQIMTHRRSKDDGFVHMHLFGDRDWGLIIYDEVHLLPAPVFRMTADIQATRRLGLTATLVREDGREEDVFSLIGPKRFDPSWRTLEAGGWIARVTCNEIRVPLEGAYADRYASAEPRAKHRIAAENPAKADVVRELLRRHRGSSVLVIGQYLNQLKKLAGAIGAPMITGATPYDEREVLYDRFKTGDTPVIVVSKVANFAVDLPDAAVAIQVSGSFGSRQEEAQRIGRIMRPKPGENAAWFYTLVSEGTKETEFALKRQLFMTEQGYEYELVGGSGVAGSMRMEAVE
ncbi:helicase [Paenibacillus darwinianus]|uniref:DNA 3'-5' helicase n=1 Tax=Paenibacillus darwinianus TaxID=1380763 RepID=A0A9W5S168_9BACL|nr:DNA repair helicase XPB [Paenibacillus darwinianus]EXX88089.1 helicase [Paenibacillus darwinianus]EXX88371.1 helicase [Paenibacillus darwinianus]EXX89927.1 helicase [Paenibacillus darwinianus]